MRGFTRLLQTAVLLLLFTGQAIGGNPTWTVTNYTSSTTITAKDSIVFYTPTAYQPVAGDFVGAFVGTECRMIAQLFVYNSKLYISGVIQGGTSGVAVTGETATNTPEEVTFKVWKTAATSANEVTLKGTVFTKPGDHIDLYGLGSPNRNNNLKSLTITGNTLSPAFDPAVTTYNVSAASLPATAAYLAVAADSRATVAVVNAKDLNSSVAADRTATITVTAENGTTKVYTVVYAQTACTVVAPTASDVTVCANDAASKKILTATGLATATFNWYSDAAKKTKLNATPSATFAPSAAGTYYVAQTVGCEGATQAVVYTINANPVASLVADALSYCVGSTGVTLTASDDLTGSTFDIYKGAALAGSGKTLTNAKAGSYTVVATNKTCTGTSAAVVVTESIKPTYIIAGGGTVCKGTATGADVTITLTGTAPFSLTYTDGTTAVTKTVQTSPYVITPATTAAGVFNYSVVSLSDKNCSADIAAQVAKVTVNEAAPIAVQNASACEGQSATLTATGVSTGGVVTWTPVGGTVVTGPTFTATTTVSVSAYQTVDGCKSAAVSATATINPKPTVTIALAGNVTALCKDAAPVAIQLGAVTTGSLIIDGSASSVTAFDPSIYAKGNHTLKYEITDANKCTDSAKLTVTVNKTDIPTVKEINYSIKLNETVPTLSATGSNIIWKEGTNVVAQTADFIPNVSNSVASSHTYTVSQSLNGCESPAVTVIFAVTSCTTSQVQVNTAKSICVGETNPSFTATGTANATYKWSETLGGASIESSATFTPTVTAEGTYTYYVAQTVGCEGPATSVSFTINKLPVVALNLPAEGICNTASALDLTAYASPAGGVFSGTGVANGKLDPSVNGAGSVSYLYTDLVTKCKNTATGAITVKTTPAAPTITVTPACKGGTSTLSAIPVANATLAWFDKNGASVTTPASTEAVLFSATQTLNGCTSASAEKSTVINAVPDAPVASGDPVVAGSTTAIATAQGTNIKWYNGAVLAASGSPATLPIVSLPATFTVTQTSAEGCTSLSSPITITEKIVTCTPPAKPTVAATEVSLCIGSSVEVKATSGTTNVWYGVDGKEVARTAAYSATAIGNYGVTAIENNCESEKTFVTVTAKAVTAPTIQASSNSVEVNSDDITLTVTPVGGSFSATPTATIVGSKFTPNTVGKFVVTYAAINECNVSTTATTTIDVKAPDLVSLNTIIQTATTTVTNAQYGTTINRYPTSSKQPLLDAIAAAQTVYNNGSANTPAQIADAVKALKDAIAAFEATKITPTTVDKTALTNLINTTTTASANVGTSVGQYPQAAADALITAISAATKASDAATTQADVTTAIDALNTAFDIFKAAVITASVDKTALNKAITDATTASTTNVGTAVGQHPAAAAATLKAAIEKAKQDSVGVKSQGTIDAIAKTLTDAIATYNATVNPPVTLDKKALTDLIASANDAVKPSNVGDDVAGLHTTAAAATLTAAIKKAQAMSDTATVQATITKAKTDLDAALVTYNKALVPAKVTIDATGIDNTIGKSSFISASTNVLGNVEIVWTSSNPEVATIGASDGEVTFIKAGSVYFTATIKGSSPVVSTRTTTFAVTPTIDVAGVEITFYPVPAVTNLNISGTATVAKVEVSSLTGQVLRTVSNNGDNLITIDVTGLGSSIYTVKLVFEDGSVYTAKVGKE